MQGPSMETTQTARPHLATPAIKDPIALLRADHEAVGQLFAEFETAHSVPNKKALVARICTTLSVHAQIEKEIFYPELKAALKDKWLMPEATVEHAGVKRLIAQLTAVESDGESYDAQVKALAEYVKHHVKVKQNEMFSTAKNSSLDMVELGARMAARKDALLTQAA